MDRCKVVLSVLVTWFVIGAVMGAVLMLGGCAGYPRFDPSTCTAIEHSGEVPLWECV